MVVRRRRRPIRCPVIPLGFTGLKTVLYVIDTGTVSFLSPTQMTKPYFETLASEHQWRQWLRTRTEDSTNFDQAADRLRRLCRRAGAFDPDKVRGIGVWEDSGSIIYNAGANLYVDGRCHSRRAFIHTIRSQYIYTTGKQATVPADEEVTVNEVREFEKAQLAWNWRDPSIAARLMVGATVVAFLCPTLPWRPMLLITGPTHSGKTTHAEITRKILGPLALYQVGHTTEAGLCQKLAANGDGRPVIFDEFEKMESGSQQAIIELMRIAASPSDATITKGTKEQRPITQRIHSTGIFYGINAHLQLAQDRSRWVGLHLGNLPAGDAEAVKRVEEITRRFGAEFGHRLLRRMLNRYTSFRANFKVFRRAVLRSGRDARLADLYGVLLAGWWTATHDESVTLERATKEAQFVQHLDTGEIEATRAVLDHLRSYPLPIYNQTYADTRRILDWVQGLGDPQYTGPSKTTVEKALATAGLRVTGDTIYVATNTKAGIGRVFKGTPWENGAHAEALRQLGAKTEGKGRSFAGIESKAVNLPLGAFLGTENPTLDQRSRPVEAVVEA